MPFKRYVEIGRVALISYGEEQGQVVVISDILDQNRALVDAPGQARRVVGFKRMALTDMKIDIPRLASKKVLTAKFAEAGASLSALTCTCRCGVRALS
jgi:large subunit ribosomal protein L14e